ncbi:MAG: hypothetical protein JXJ04_10905 [Spirochaetales bacterium]|nr:hypothetical protein [Spirochaetales bacterium]
MIDNIILNNIRDIINNKTGIVLRDDWLLDMEIVLQSRFIKNKMTPEDYLNHLKKNYDELIILASHFTIQETSFYRNKTHFDRIKYQIIPELLNERRKNKDKHISILSAGSSTGEEPYTLAMILTELIPDIIEWDINIIGTDINAEVLDYAKNGLYTKYKMRNIDSWYIERFFNKIDNVSHIIYQLKSEIKNMVEFRQCNLIREPFELAHLHDFDIILCENVIIYFNYQSIQRLISNFYNILRDKGFLFLGYSETLNMVEHSFTLSWWQDSFAYQKVKDDSMKETAPPLPQYSVFKKKIDQPDELTDSDNWSYEEMIYLLIKYCDEQNVNNCITILKTLDTSTIETDENFYIIKAEYLFDSKKYIDAANACRKAMSINPHFIDAHIMLGYIYLELNILESAEFELKTVLYIDKSSILGWYFYALYNQRVGDKQKYIECMEKARKLYADNDFHFNTALFPLRKTLNQYISHFLIKTLD